MTQSPQSIEHEPILDVRRLTVSFHTDEGLVTAVDGIDFQARRGKTLGIVGESGSGKSVSTKACIKLLPKNAVIGTESRILLRTKEGRTLDVAPLPPNRSEVRQIRGGEVAMIFQEPMASFSPVYTVGNQLIEAIRLHTKLGKRDAQSLAVDMLGKVGIADPNRCIRQYPHELSGGMRQRAMIAIALSTYPSVLIADEPTTALDVTIQAQILDLMRRIQSDMHMSILFITHDMGVIAQVADDVAVMYLGRFMEQGSTRELIDDPKHPYTQGLLNAIPAIDRLHRRLRPVGGDIPSPMERPAGCPFYTRCPRRMIGWCDTSVPPSVRMGPDRSAACLLCEGFEG